MMRLSRLLTSAAGALNGIAPDRAAAWAGAALAFLLGLALLGNTLEGAAAGTQMLATSLGAVIAAFLASRLAAYLVRVVGLWAGWPELSRRQQLVAALAMALGSATFVLTILVLLS